MENGTDCAVDAVGADEEVGLVSAGGWRVGVGYIEGHSWLGR